MKTLSWLTSVRKKNKTRRQAALQTRSDLCIPRNETARASFPISTFMFLWAIYIFPRSVHLFCCSKIGRSIVEIINRSQTHECWNWEHRPRSFISRNICFKISVKCLWPEFYIDCAQDVQVIGFYESPADYVSGNLNRQLYFFILLI